MSGPRWFRSIRPSVRQFGILLAGCTVLAAACAPAAAPRAPRVYDVQVDAKAAPFFLTAGAYFPREVQAHPGDTVRFTAVDRGEIHTVTFGSLIDAGLRRFDATPTGRRPSLQELDLPPLLIGTPPTEVGQSAVQPCFLSKGVPPLTERCSPEQQRQPELTGTYSLVNSGYLAGGSVFAVRLADTIKPGTYSFICLLHGPEMRGRVVVVEQDRKIPTPSEVAARGAAELAGLVSALEPAVGLAARDLTGGTVVAGVQAPNTEFTQATVFTPVDVSVRVGEAVIWNVRGFHTISFNAPQDAVGTLVRTSDGGWALNRRLFEPERSPVRHVGPPGGPFTLDSGPWDGKGFRSSGLIASEGTAPVAYRVAFTVPGTYSYKCLFHTDMEGLVRVTDR